MISQVIKRSQTNYERFQTKLHIVSKLSNVFWSETRYSKVKAQTTFKSFVGDCCLGDLYWTCNREMSRLESSHVQDAGCFIVFVEFRRSFRRHSSVKVPMFFVFFFIGVLGHSSQWIFRSLRVVRNEIRHCFELRKSWSVAVTCNTCFAFVTGFCRLSQIAADKMVTAVDALIEWFAKWRFQRPLLSALACGLSGQCQLFCSEFSSSCWGFCLLL